MTTQHTGRKATLTLLTMRGSWFILHVTHAFMEAHLERFVTLLSFHPDKGDVLVPLWSQVLIVGCVHGYLQPVVGIDGKGSMWFAVSVSLHQESVMFAFFVLFVLLLLFSGEKIKIQKSTDYFSKANPSTFSILFSCFLIFFSTFLGHLQKWKNLYPIFGCNISLIKPTIFEKNCHYRILF